MYDKLWAKQDKIVTIKILYMVWRKIRDRINQWNIIIIISTTIPKISKVWIKSFVSINLHLHHCLYFAIWINSIVPSFNTGGKDFLGGFKGSYYDSMPFLFKNITVIKLIEVMSIIDRFFAETPDGKSPWMKQNILYLIRFFFSWPNSQDKKFHMFAS